MSYEKSWTKHKQILPILTGVGGVVRNHDGDWIAGFFHYEDGGDALLAELRAIQIALDFCSKKCYVNVICESDCLEAVDPIIDGHDQGRS